jgi:hypothetical protein
MRNILAALLLGMGIAAGAQPVKWPPLPTEGFIVGRAATKADVEAGSAVFVAADDDRVIVIPMPLEIPQYAYFVDSGARIPAIILQAEKVQGQTLLGARLLDGRYMAGFIGDFELLGRHVANRAP